MSDLDIIDAEIVEDLTYAEARDLTDEIKGDLDAIWEKVKIAWHGKAWKALGHKSWDDYCATEFRSSGLALPREERPEVVQSLKHAGLSNRGIASATGISEPTVRRALAGASNDAPAVQQGADGKTYTIPARPAAPANVNTDTGEIVPSAAERQAAQDAIAREANAIENVAFMADTLGRLDLLDAPEYRARLIENNTAYPDTENPSYVEHFNPQGIRALADLLNTLATEMETAS